MMCVCVSWHSDCDCLCVCVCVSLSLCLCLHSVCDVFDVYWASIEYLSTYYFNTMCTFLYNG